LQPPPDSEVKDCLRAAALINGFDIGAPDAGRQAEAGFVKAALISQRGQSAATDHLSSPAQTKMVV
jgi:hypothetical protein